VRLASLRDTSSEPTGFIFLGSGEAAFVNLQHRDVDGANNRGSLMMISGFKVGGRERDRNQRSVIDRSVLQGRHQDTETRRRERRY
jgi:secreted PhoX family phosphatase